VVEEKVIPFLYLLGIESRLPSTYPGHYTESADMNYVILCFVGFPLLSFAAISTKVK
jgi:hypothetical protein